ncbi:MAG: hypothetical protein JXA17_01900 [Dehalococcoidales bacterium]|nr:hypothetical protein [Dehalococcoidales bacterium]
MTSFKHRAWTGVLALVCVLTCLFAVAPMPVMNGQAYADTGPDLVIDSISWSPEVPTLRDTITFTATVRNQGDAYAPPCDMDYYIDDCLIDTIEIDSISAGDSAVYQFTWRAQTGDHTIKAIIDSNYTVTEANENNNIKNYVFSVIAPDLVIESITWLPQTVSMGEAVTFKISVKNRGNKTSGYCFIEFFIDDATRGQRDCGQLEPGESKLITYTWTTQAGQHSLKATADIFNQCSESDETNNNLTVPFNTAAPDLIVQSILWSPVEHTDTDNITIHVTVRNQGLGTAPPSRVDFYVDGAFFSQIYFDTLNGGCYDTKTFTWFAGPSEHILSAVVDADNLIYESYDSNNTYSTTLPAAAPPDLLIDSISWTPNPPIQNSLMTYTITVRNVGNRTVQTCSLAFYLGSSHKISREVGPILPGGTASASIQYFISDAPFTVRAIVDPGNHVSESDETNNEMEASVIPVEPTMVDFYITTLTYTPQNPAVGDEVTITTKLKNNSTVHAGTSHLAYLIDGEIVDILQIKKLNAKNSIIDTFTWIATPGTHTITVVADSNDYYYETDETNNIKEITISTLAPDLAIQGITWSPEIPSQGNSLDISFTIINVGTYKSEGCYIDYYVDGVWAGNQYIEEINAGETVTRTLPWTLVNDYHTFKIIIDKNNDVPEIDESNNEKTAVIPAPDLVIESITYSPDEFSENDTITFTITVINTGSTVAEGSYLNCHINNILQASIPVDTIPAGSSAEFVFNWTALPGQNTLKVLIDGADIIVESDETNNIKSITLQALVPVDDEIPPEVYNEDISDNTTSNETQEVIPGILDDDSLPPAQDDEVALPVSNMDELTELFNEETPLWQNILGSQWLVIGVGVVGIAAISALLMLRKRARARAY